MVRESKEESENSKAELAKLKKTIRYTKINEIEMEKQAVLEQNKRQAKMIIHFQTKLEEQVRGQEEFNQLEQALKTRTQELHQVAQDNARYEEIIEELEMKNRELASKAMHLLNKNEILNSITGLLEQIKFQNENQNVNNQDPNFKTHQV